MINYDDLTPKNLRERLLSFLEQSGLDRYVVAELMWRRREYIDGMINGVITVENADCDEFKYFFKFFKRADIIHRMAVLMETYDLSAEDIAKAKDIPEDVIDRILAGETEPTDEALTELGVLLLRYDEGEFLDMAKLAGIHILARELANCEKDEKRKAKMLLVLAEMQEAFIAQHPDVPVAFIYNPGDILGLRFWPKDKANALMIELAFVYPFWPHGLRLDTVCFRRGLEGISGLLEPEISDYHVHVGNLLKMKDDAEKCHKDFSSWVLVAGLLGAVALIIVAPFAAAIIGSGAGLFGAAATAYGLAFWGGGALASGGAGMAAGMWLIGGLGATGGIAAGVLANMLSQLGVDGALTEILKAQISFRFLLDKAQYIEAKLALSEIEQRIGEMDEKIGYLLERNDADADPVKAAQKIRDALKNAKKCMEESAKSLDEFRYAW